MKRRCTGFKEIYNRETLHNVCVGSRNAASEISKYFVQRA